jgi:hypothetical protein
VSEQLLGCASDDAITQMLWRQVRAKLLAPRGEHAEAERLARATAVAKFHEQARHPRFVATRRLTVAAS